MATRSLIFVAVSAMLVLLVAGPAVASGSTARLVSYFLVKNGCRAVTVLGTEFWGAQSRSKPRFPLF
jgi:hypothetical protein